MAAEIRIHTEIPEHTNENEFVYDIDIGIQKAKEFISKTANHTRDFYKISKKMDGAAPDKQKKAIAKFTKERLLNQFKFITKDYFQLGELDMDENQLLVYVSGIFIIGNTHNKDIKPNIDKIIAHSLYEMSKKTLEARNG